MAAIQSAPNGAQHVDDARRLIAQRIVDSRGHSYVVVVRFPEPSVLNRSLVEFLSPRRSGRWIGPVGGMRVLFVLLVGGVFCFLLTRHLSRPIEQLRWATGNIASEQLQTRVDPGVLRRHDELADLGRDFNRMANRIEQLVTAQRQLLADVSHALQSPLARLNVALGLARRGSDPAAFEHLDRIERETERLNALIGQLLTMARLDSGVHVERRTIFDIAAVAAEVAIDAQYETRAHHRRVRFQSSGDCFVECGTGTGLGLAIAKRSFEVHGGTA